MMTAKPVGASAKSGRLVILKAWLKANNRKWSFEWNAVPVSAPIKDADFLARIERREHLIGSGDALDVELRYSRFTPLTLGTYVNDQSTFEVVKVVRVTQRETPLKPFLD